MQLHEYAIHDAIALRDLVRSGELGPDEVEDVARRGLETADADLNALALPLFTPALERDPNGPFAGVPFLLKDCAPLAEGVPFFAGSRSVRGIVAQRDSDLMTRFRGAGLTTLGLTTAPELGLSFATEPVKHGPTRNPWDPRLGVGGSSGGAAALVAAGAVPVAHANDGAGSIRVPAACCGVVGLKPSRGRTPCGPDAGEALFGGLSDFALTRTVRDAAHMLDALAGPGVGDKYTAPPPRRPFASELEHSAGSLRVGLTTRPWCDAAVDPVVAAAAVQTGRLLEDLGHGVEEASPAVDWDAVLHGFAAYTVASAAPMLTAPRRPDPRHLEATTRQILREVEEVSALDLIGMFDAQNRVSRSVGAFFTQYDVLITPTVARLPIPHGTLRYDEPGHTVRSWLQRLFDFGPFTAVFNLSGHPAISLPLGESQDRLPIGVQLVARYGREDVLIHVASCLERARPWHHRQPRLHVARCSPALSGREVPRVRSGCSTAHAAAESENS